jgi:RimJ/RimL family protein N-acetyltransferase
MNHYSTKDGRPFTVRKPTAEDASEIIRYSKILFASTDQVLTTPEEYTITEEAEKKWIESLNENPNALLQIAEINHQVIGFLFFIPNTKRKNSHTGEFGMNVHPEYQGLGVGNALMEVLLAWAKGNPQIEKVLLQVLVTNHRAIQLYKKFGFVEEGRHIKAIKQLDGGYVDILQMYIETITT